MPTPRLIAVMGETASGKTALAEAIADDLGADLINADAFQAYRYMDIGTAKPHNAHRYQLLNVKNPDEPFGVGEWINLVIPLLQAAFHRDRPVVLVGGSGLYIRALLEEFKNLHEAPDPALRKQLASELAEKGIDAMTQRLNELDPHSNVALDNPRRVLRALEQLISASPPLQFKLPAFEKTKVAIQCDVSEIDMRIDHRTRHLLNNGWVEEVKTLLALGYGPEDPGFSALGYSNIVSFLKGEMQWEEVLATTIAETRRYAKRQRTWLRSEPGLKRIPLSELDEMVNQVMLHLTNGSD